MHDPSHPHMASGLNFMGSGVALLGAVFVRASDALFAAGSAWSFDDVKWGVSVAISVGLGGLGVYMHVVERLDKHREKRLKIVEQGRIERAEMEAESRRREERADFEERLWQKNTEAEMRRRIEAGVSVELLGPPPVPASIGAK